MTRAPTTLHEHFRTDPRGADSFGRWIEDRIWELLQGASRLQVMLPVADEWRPFYEGAAHKMLALRDRVPIGFKARTVLLNGTVIKEWPGNNSAKMA